MSKHNGRLDEQDNLHVRLTGDDSEEFRGMRKVVIMDNLYNGVDLSPKQALSLLAWLRQEEETLKQLAEEQEAHKE